MTALPQQRARRLSVAEFAALPEDSGAHYELLEGLVMMSPRPLPDHQFCVQELGSRLRAACPEEFNVLPEVDVDLELVSPGKPGFVRAPDLVVARREARLRVRAEGGMLRAGEVVLVIEVLSPSTRRIDTVIKHGEYADAGIPAYWMIDLDGGPALTAAHLAGEFGYVDAAPVTGTFVADHPFPVRIELESLV